MRHCRSKCRFVDPITVPKASGGGGGGGGGGGRYCCCRRRVRDSTVDIFTNTDQRRLIISRTRAMCRRDIDGGRARRRLAAATCPDHRLYCSLFPVYLRFVYVRSFFSILVLGTRIADASKPMFFSLVCRGKNQFSVCFSLICQCVCVSDSTGRCFEIAILGRANTACTFRRASLQQVTRVDFDFSFVFRAY
jgi:hypothetical protein